MTDLALNILCTLVSSIRLLSNKIGIQIQYYSFQNQYKEKNMLNITPCKIWYIRKIVSSTLKFISLCIQITK